MFTDLILSIFAIVSLLQLGLLVDFYLINKRRLNFQIATFFALGIGAIGISQMVSSLLGLKIDKLLATFWGVSFFIPLFFDQKLKRAWLAAISTLAYSLKTAQKTFLLLLLSLLVATTMATFSHTPWGDDAYERHLAKANYFYIDGQVTHDNLYLAEPNDDPIFWPLTATWLYHFLEKSSEFWVQIIPLVLFILTISEFWRRLPPALLHRYAWITILAFTPLLWGQVVLPEYSGNPDLMLSFFFLLATAALIKKEVIYAGIFFGLAALIKNDAFPALVGFIILAITTSLVTKTRLQRTALAIAVILLVINIAWKVQYGLSNRFLERDIRRVLEERPFFKYNRYSLQSFREQFRQTHNWALGWLVIAFFTATRLKLIAKDQQILMVFLLIGFQFLGYLWVYYVNSEDQATEIATSIARLSLQLFPSALLTAAFLSAKKTES